jgi:hypothetical protein
LAVRPVRPEDPRTASLLRVGPDLVPTPTGNAEYVVRTDDGTTLAIVQPADPGLRPGALVILSQGERATLAARQ